MIVGIHHVAISVDDIDAAENFYTEAFGLQPGAVISIQHLYLIVAQEVRFE